MIYSTIIDHSYEVAALSKSESRNLLLRTLPESYDTRDASAADAVDGICKLLGGLPLAIMLTSAFIQHTMRTFEEALQLLTEKRDWLQSWPSTEGAREILPLNMLWEANLASLPIDALNLLQVMAFLDPDSIGEDILCSPEIHKSSLKLPENDLAYLMALSSLSNYSLIRRDRSSFCIHRLLQDVTTQRMDEKTLQNSFETAVQVIWSIFPKQSAEGLLMSSQWLQCQNYLAHVEALELRFREIFHRLSSTPLPLAELTYFCSW